MKEKMITVITKSAIWLTLMSLLAMLVRTEWLLADIFHMEWNGLTAMEYAFWYIRERPALFAIEAILVLVLSILTANVIYRQQFEE